MSWSEDFPRLTAQNHRITSPASATYNCVAWAADDVERWWQPGTFWLPEDWPKDDFGLGALERVFLELGYQSCDTGAELEPGFKKVALLAPNYPGGKDALAGVKHYYKGAVADEIMTKLGQLDYAAEIADLPSRPDVAQIVADRFDVDPKSVHVTVHLDSRLTAFPIGQIVGRMNEVRPVADVMADLITEYEQTVERLNKI